jgi:hypothetical protein
MGGSKKIVLSKVQEVNTRQKYCANTVLTTIHVLHGKV